MNRKLMMPLLVSAMIAWAQEPFEIKLDHLAQKASESVDVTLDASMLQFASGFLSEKKAGEAEAKRLTGKLKGIVVRSFKFDSPGQYSASDVESVRSQLRAPQWSRIVGVRSKGDGENVDVYLRKDGVEITGLAVIAAEPKELTIVNITGPLQPEDLAKLGGHFGVPNVNLGGSEGVKASKKPKKE
jgi:hypothetical protein